MDQADPLRQQRAVWQLVPGEATALNRMLAYEILAKKKQGFGLPFGVWANQHRWGQVFSIKTLTFKT